MAANQENTIVDLKMFRMGKHNGSVQPGLDYWRGKTDEQRMQHEQAEFCANFEREKMAYSERQLLSYLAGYLLGLHEALTDQEMQGDVPFEAERNGTDE